MNDSRLDAFEEEPLKKNCKNNVSRLKNVSRTYISDDLSSRMADVAKDNYRATLIPDESVIATNVLGMAGGIPGGVGYFATAASITVGISSEIRQQGVRSANAEAFFKDINGSRAAALFAMSGVFVTNDIDGTRVELSNTSATGAVIDKLNNLLEGPPNNIRHLEGRGLGSEVNMSHLFTDSDAVVSVVYGEDRLVTSTNQLLQTSIDEMAIYKPPRGM